MTRPLVLDAGDGLQIWRVAGNILNTQTRTPYKGWISSLGFGVRLTTPHHRKQLVTKCHAGPRTRMDSLERHKQMKMDMIYGTLNVRSLYRAGSVTTFHNLHSSPTMIRMIKSRKMR
jgi:hypothetical protein